MTTNETVAKMFQLIREQSDNNPHFTLGYIESMMNTLCKMSPQVLEEVISTIDYFESKEEM
jgi:hypothetical protein